jgi:hypothetical protein
VPLETGGEDGGPASLPGSDLFLGFGWARDDGGKRGEGDGGGGSEQGPHLVEVFGAEAVGDEDAGDLGVAEGEDKPKDTFGLLKGTQAGHM